LRYIIKIRWAYKIRNIYRTAKQLAITLKALAHPASIAILQYIINQNACICNDLVEELGLAQATISQHLKELKTLVSSKAI
jgi:DNA-binding transcriptional ArsR family regulator